MRRRANRQVAKAGCTATHPLFRTLLGKRDPGILSPELHTHLRTVASSVTDEKQPLETMRILVIEENSDLSAGTACSLRAGVMRWTPPPMASTALHLARSVDYDAIVLASLGPRQPDQQCGGNPRRNHHQHSEKGFHPRLLDLDPIPALQPLIDRPFHLNKIPKPLIPRF